MTPKSLLFSSISIRDLQIKNRMVMSPMCQYSSVDGLANDWHFNHLGSRAVGGAGLILTEAAAVSDVGRISPGDLGIWNDAQRDSLKSTIEFVKKQGSAIGIQLAHAGRKASCNLASNGGGSLKKDQGSWETLGPSAIAFNSEYAIPKAMTAQDIEQVVTQFEHASRRSLEAGFQVVELHMAHGYLLHEFLSPLSNTRTDEWGGSLEKRMALPLLVAKRVRNIWPDSLPVFVRISATDWAPRGWDLEQSIQFCVELKKLGIDLIDVSTGGLVDGVKIPVAKGYQVPFARDIKHAVQIKTGAVGLIDSGREAEEILNTQCSDLIFVGREFLRDPYFPMKAAKELNVDFTWPKQYERARRG